MKKKEIMKAVGDMEDKYSVLVWAARTPAVRIESNPEISKKIKKIEKSYPDEMEILKSPEGEWAHGFNSGALAMARYILEMEESGRKVAFWNFPRLDT